MATIFDDMPIGVAVAETRRDDRPAEDRQVDLTAMGVSGEGQADPRGNGWKDIRFVDEEDDRVAIVGDAGERPREIVDTSEAAEAEGVGELIADPGKPEGRPPSGFEE